MQRGIFPFCCVVVKFEDGFACPTRKEARAEKNKLAKDLQDQNSKLEILVRDLTADNRKYVWDYLW